MCLALVVMTFTMCKNQPEKVPSNPEEALAELIAGNERYANEKCINPHSDMERVEETASITVLSSVELCIRLQKLVVFSNNISQFLREYSAL